MNDLFDIMRRINERAMFAKTKKSRKPKPVFVIEETTKKVGLGSPSPLKLEYGKKVTKYTINSNKRLPA